MNVRLLIEAIVRQMTVLLAELATSGGLRAPLANVADRIFIELARELESHGVSRTVSADMFGMALRTYLRRIQRHDESVTDRGTSLWEAVLKFVEARGVVSRSEVLSHFARDEEDLVRGVLQDLTDSGLVFRTGIRAAAVYRVASPEEIGGAKRFADEEARDNLLWAIVRREGPLSRTALVDRASVRDTELDESLSRLTSEGRIQTTEANGERHYLARSLVIPMGQRSGWEAAIYDHFGAVVRTIICKLRYDAEGARPDDRVGGSTYTFNVWNGHPLSDKVYGQLARFRAETSALRREVDEYNESNPGAKEGTRVTTYMGQYWVSEEKENDA